MAITRRTASLIASATLHSLVLSSTCRDARPFTDPLGNVDASLIAGLDQQMMTSALGVALAGQGIVLHKRALTITVVTAGSAWDVTDAQALAVGTANIAQTYQLRKNNDMLEVRVAPVLSVIDHTGTVDDAGRPAPCGRQQEDWDVLSGQFASKFTGVNFNLPADHPGRIVRAAVRNVHVSGYEPWDPQSEQQGAVRFTITIPEIDARNEDPGADIRATEPSYIYVVLAPFVQDGKIRWWVREFEIHLGRVDVDVDLGVVSWLALLGFIPGLGIFFLAPLVDPIADSIATSSVNDNLKPPDTGSLQALVQEALQGWVDDRLGPDAPQFESIHLRKFLIRTWIRSSALTSPARSQIGVLPALISFPQVRIGDAPARRAMLIENSGAVPVLLENVQVSAGGAEFRIESETVWPSILDSGGSTIVRLAFVPAPPAGFRSGAATVTFNGGQTIDIPFTALATPTPAASIRTRPREVLNFGVVVAGQQTGGEVQVYNDGDGTLGVATPQIEGDPAMVAAFAIVGAAPLSIPTGGSGVVRLIYAPAQNAGGSHQARLVLESNDPAQARVEIRLFGAAAPPGALFVQPTAIQFNDSPLDANIPPLPPGLPPTVHRGSARGMNIYNTGGAPLTVEASSFVVRGANAAVSNDYHLWQTDGSAMPQADRVLLSGAFLTVIIQFLPVTAGQHDVTMEIRGTDPTQSVIIVNIQGRGVA